MAEQSSFISPMEGNVGGAQGGGTGGQLVLGTASTGRAGKLDDVKLRALGTTYYGQWEIYKKNRYQKEIQWLKNMRQFRGMYDPEVDAQLRKGGSRAYPKITRIKVIGTVARIMEMLFPQSEKNWGIKASPLPNLSNEDTQTAINTATQIHAQSGKQGEVGSEEIEREIAKIATKRAERMSTKIEDQLDEIEYITLARRVIFSGVIFGIGILKGPLAEAEKTRMWAKNENGQFVAREINRLKPVYEFVPCWNYYPDLSAKTRASMDAEYERNIMNKQQVMALKARQDYEGTQIDLVLQTYPTGNYAELHWETALRMKNSDRQNVTSIELQKYEVIDRWGAMMGYDLAAAGQDVAEADMNKMFMVWSVQVGPIMIKAVKVPWARQQSPYHTFIYEEDDINVLGVGLPEVIRDSQMAVNEACRMMLDNASVVCGPNLELDIDLLIEGQTLDINAFKVWLKEGGKGRPTNAANQAVRNIAIDSHLTELIQIVKMFLEFADTETAMPPPTLGDVSSGKGKEAYRTSQGTSMLLGAAALPIRDVVRHFDTFTTSFITSAYDWNMKFTDDPDIKGDYTIIARGSTSLIAKEVRAQQLDNLKVTLSEDDKDEIDTRRLLEERMKARDLPMDILLDPEEVAKRKAAKLQEQQKAAALQEEMLRATVRKTLADAVKSLSLANKAQTAGVKDIFAALMEALNDEGTGAGNGQSGNANAQAGAGGA